MALPKQIQAQVDALAALEQQAAQHQPKPDETPEPADPAPEVQEAASAPAPAEAPKPVDDARLWEQRYRSLQGQYNAQVPQLQQQVQTLTETVAKLTDELKTKAPAAPEPKAAKELVTKQDVDAFGEDLIDVARRIATEEFGKREAKYQELIERLEAQLAEAKGQVDGIAQVQQKLTEQQFFGQLDKRLPAWQQVQATPECQQWLGSKVPGAGYSWNDVLVHAAGQREIDSVMEVFDAFFALHPHLKPGAPKPAASRASQELQRQVAPTKSAASTAQPQAKRVYSHADYASESMRQLTLMKQGRHDEAAAIEAELNAALAEGRIR